MSGNVIIRPHSELAEAQAREGLGAFISFDHPTATTDGRAAPDFSRPGVRQAVLTCWDTEKTRRGFLLHRTIKYSPAREQVQAGLDFAGEFFAAKPEGTLAVTCLRGKSRSTAMAMAILYKRAFGELTLARSEKRQMARQALETLLVIRPEAIPNLLILRHADAIMDTGGALVAAVKANRKIMGLHAAMQAARGKYVERMPARDEALINTPLVQIRPAGPV